MFKQFIGRLHLNGIAGLFPALGAGAGACGKGRVLNDGRQLGDLTGCLGIGEHDSGGIAIGLAKTGSFHGERQKEAGVFDGHELSGAGFVHGQFLNAIPQRFHDSPGRLVPLSGTVVSSSLPGSTSATLSYYSGVAD